MDGKFEILASLDDLPNTPYDRTQGQIAGQYKRFLKLAKPADEQS